MLDVIQLLPDSLANKIAAGEVVQRPASAVKELLENAVDAEATHIKLVLKEGGSALIQVIDNGKGMSVTDARMCWERHATSKIRQVEDLFNIRSFGFRGEALASIAAVAQVEMKTKRAEDNIGTHIIIEGSKFKKQEPIQCNEGTNIAIKNLFFNLPARRNFLKSLSVETRHCVDQFIRVALAQPQIDFTLFNNDRELFRLMPTEGKQRFIELMGYKSNIRLIEVQEETSFISVNGWVGEPTQAKKTRGEQFFFVNNRFIKDNYLNHAVFSAYDSLMEKDKFPSFMLNISIDPKHIDINVHPTKTEIKFDDDRAAYIFVKSVVRKALSGLLADITPDDGAVAHFLNQPKPQFPQNVEIKVDKGFNPFGASTKPYSPKIHPDWQKFYELDQEEEPVQQEIKLENPPTGVWSISHCFMIDKAVIVVKVNGLLKIVHAKRAQLRVHYDRHLKALKHHPIASQQLLFPRTIILTENDFELFCNLQEDIARLGCDMHAFGNNKVIVNGLPPNLVTKNEQDLLEGLLEKYKQHKQKLDLPHIGQLALALSYNMIKSENNLHEEELMGLVTDLFNSEHPETSPLGEKIIINYTNSDWNALFDH
jgi:DNA mismatch repair protein MutL